MTVATGRPGPFAGSGYFRLARQDARWTFVHPDGGPFVSLGVNHAEETNLKYPHNIAIWERKYGSRENWIAQGVVADLRDWQFNTLGWTQEYVTGDFGEDQDWFGAPFNLGHSFGWSASELRNCGMPYVVTLPVAEIQDWRGDPTFPDVFSAEFDQWCAFLARSFCLEHAHSRNLIGYFLTDIPAWIAHASGKFFPGMEGLSGPAFDDKLYEVASKYYGTVSRHIRAVDPNHLILGDRYNGNKGLPEPVLRAMAKHIDVLSIQYFCGPTEAERQDMVATFAHAQAITGKPVLNADIGNWSKTELNPKRVTGLASQAERGASYVSALEALVEQPWFIGWHWCSYLENTARGWGIKDPWDEPYADFIEPVRRFNKAVTERWAACFESSEAAE